MRNLVFIRIAYAVDASINRKDQLAMLLNEFNETPEINLAAALRPCIDVERWIQEIIDARPYAAVEEIFKTANDAAAPFTAEEVNSALAHHPRIGERLSGASTEAALSSAEQSTIDPADTMTAAALRSGNVAYEEKFGQVFLIRALGRSPEEILSALHERLENPPHTERLIIAEQLREIALLRLKAVVNA
ncbi:2-oxo-4-hydroxy-4-carboxy-5-ureidoimidazoline decarboxylase [Arthrobacter glacialis]|uniref:2-oxo-4-hydroxy-4-carboxy-5-ureidoimidazoline decarboxylase n=1 Tax=Arthrobacter glacialis TaxID=1664 RepID=UPI002796355E|nr:2-oxo-4-hydroxy-4-carboxy-5-ureidoimidazoline decarboxylase [Arthrobacter glacialis]